MKNRRQGTKRILICSITRVCEPNHFKHVTSTFKFYHILRIWNVAKLPFLIFCYFRQRKVDFQRSEKVNNFILLATSRSYLKGYQGYCRENIPILAAFYITPFPSFHPENRFHLWFQYGSLLICIAQREIAISSWVAVICWLTYS